MGFWNQKEKQEVKEDLNKISARLADAETEKKALWFDEDEFKSVYTFFSRFTSRVNIGACKIMFMFRPISVTMPDKEFRALVHAFGETAIMNLRKSDILMQPKKNEFLLLLPGLAEEKAEGVVERILGSYEKVPGADQLAITFIFESLDSLDTDKDDEVHEEN